MATYNAPIEETVSGKIDIVRDSTNASNFNLYRTSDGMYLQAGGTLSNAQTRAAQMVSLGEV